jgi:hypothetical protein
MPIIEHAQNMHAHVDNLEAHHAKLGAGVTELYSALELATQLLQQLTLAYGEIQGMHSDMHNTVQGARQTATSIHEEAQTSV